MQEKVESEHKGWKKLRVKATEVKLADQDSMTGPF